MQEAHFVYPVLQKHYKAKTQIVQKTATFIDALLKKWYVIIAKTPSAIT